MSRGHLQTRLDRSVLGFVGSSQIPGLCVAVYRAGKLDLLASYGTSAAGTSRLEPDAVFCVASLTKPVFARLVLSAVDQGRLSLDDPLTEHIVNPDVANHPWAQGITPRRILCHSAGFPFRWRRRGGPFLDYEPGTDFQYSSEGIVFLEQVLRQLTGMAFSTVARKNLFEPLGMTSCGFSAPEMPNAQWAGGIAPPTMPSPIAQGGLFATATDYGLFVVDTLTGGGLSSELRRQFLEPAVDAHFDAQWSLGWGIVGAPKQASESARQPVFHSGFGAGCRSHVQADPDSRDAVVVLTNGPAGWKPPN